MLAACSAQTTLPTDNDSSSSSSIFLEQDSSSSDSVDLDASSVSSAAATSSASSAEAVVPGTTRTITINVTDWSFNPASITVAKGEKVKLQLVGGTGIHSFAVPGLGMNVRIAAGETVTVDLPTNTEGTFDARCAIPCGPGHRDMKATIVITA